MWINLYSIYADILANPDDADHIRNITQDFLNTDRLDALAAMNISPVTFAVHTDNKTPGIDSKLECLLYLLNMTFMNTNFGKWHQQPNLRKTSHRYAISLSSFLPK